VNIPFKFHSKHKYQKVILFLKILIFLNPKCIETTSPERGKIAFPPHHGILISKREKAILPKNQDAL
jgi:hypothetical protein